jgi:hypothetical protein
VRRPVLQLIAVGAVAAVPACGFPSVTFDATPADGAADGQEQRDATGADSVSPVDGQVGSDGGLDALVGDGASADAMPSADGPADGPVNAPDAAEEAGNPCDVDKDGYRAKSCGGTDCCDIDPDAHPYPDAGTVPWFTVAADSCGSWDYNCDGTVEYEFLSSVTCSGTGATGCNGGPGFTTNQGCGTSAATYSNCEPNGLLTCKAVADPMSVTQGCH